MTEIKTIKAKDSVVNTNTLIILLLKRFFNPFLSVRKIIINTKKEKETSGRQALLPRFIVTA